MFTLPILPDELRIPLDTIEIDGVVVGEYPGVTAIVKPFDIVSASKWNDAFPGATRRSEAATQLVFDQLIRIEGLEMKGKDGKAEDFDPKNAFHRMSLPMAMRSAIYLALRTRATLPGEAEKNSDSPSDSDGTSGSASSPAEAVASGSATS
jgi:hypothetical protein